MDPHALRTLEFDKILAKLVRCTSFSAGQELALANQIHDSAIDSLQVEAQATQSHLNRLLHHPLEGVLPLIVPLITAAISHLRKPAAAAE